MSISSTEKYLRGKAIELGRLLNVLDKGAQIYLWRELLNDLTWGSGMTREETVAVFLQSIRALERTFGPEERVNPKWKYYHVPAEALRDVDQEWVAQEVVRSSARPKDASVIARFRTSTTPQGAKP